MGYGENRSVPKLGTNRLLDEVIHFHVNGRSGFIQHKNLCLAQKSSGQADQLTLPNTGEEEEEEEEEVEEEEEEVERK